VYKRTSIQLYTLHNRIQIGTCDNTMYRNLICSDIPFHIPSKRVLRNRNNRFHPIYHNQNKSIGHNIRNKRFFCMCLFRKTFCRILSTSHTPGIPHRKRSCMRHIYRHHYQRNNNRYIQRRVRQNNTIPVLASLPNTIFLSSFLFLVRYVPLTFISTTIADKIPACFTITYAWWHTLLIIHSFAWFTKIPCETIRAEHTIVVTILFVTSTLRYSIMAGVSACGLLTLSSTGNYIFVIPKCFTTRTLFLVVESSHSTINTIRRNRW
jgi:hypothetical protein